jgi:hypothetical protein
MLDLVGSEREACQLGVVESRVDALDVRADRVTPIAHYEHPVARVRHRHLQVAALPLGQVHFPMWTIAVRAGPVEPDPGRIHVQLRAEDVAYDGGAGQEARPVLLPPVGLETVSLGRVEQREPSRIQAGLGPPDVDLGGRQVKHAASLSAALRSGQIPRGARQISAWPYGDAGLCAVQLCTT